MLRYVKHSHSFPQFMPHTLHFPKSRTHRVTPEQTRNTSIPTNRHARAAYTTIRPIHSQYVAQVKQKSDNLESSPPRFH